MVRFIIKFAQKIFQGVIISVFSLNVCTQICYNGLGVANSFGTYFAATQAMRSVLALPGGSIYCRQSIPPTCKYRRPSWVKKMIYHSNNRNAYNQVTQ